MYYVLYIFLPSSPTSNKPEAALVKLFFFPLSNCHMCVILMTCENEEKLHGKFVGKENEGKFTCISCLITIILTCLLPCVPLDLCPPALTICIISFLMICHYRFKSIMLLPFAVQFGSQLHILILCIILEKKTPSNICSTAVLYWMKPQKTFWTYFICTGQIAIKCISRYPPSCYRACAHACAHMSLNSVKIV